MVAVFSRRCRWLWNYFLRLSFGILEGKKYLCSAGLMGRLSCRLWAGMNRAPVDLAVFIGIIDFILNNRRKMSIIYRPPD